MANDVTCKADTMRLIPWLSPSRDKDASSSGFTALTCKGIEMRWKAVLTKLYICIYSMHALTN